MKMHRSILRAANIRAGILHGIHRMYIIRSISAISIPDPVRKMMIRVTMMISSVKAIRSEQRMTFMRINSFTG